MATQNTNQNQSRSQNQNLNANRNPNPEEDFNLRETSPASVVEGYPAMNEKGPPLIWWREWTTFDIIDVPKMVLRDSPLALQWYRLENAKGERVAGELMLAFWLGIQANEAFPEVWQLDASAISGDGVTCIKSEVYLSLNYGCRKRLNFRSPIGRWYILEKHTVSGDGQSNVTKLNCRIQLRITLDAGYHDLDELTHDSSDLRPVAKQFWKPPIGVLELGILNAKNLSSMKTKDGQGMADAYCVAKYG
ncbi:unnamed protein product [Fraxinus pennsylvanica]|uniref:Uncharacterized protein n=1 Tax=Fraxinus pennsylvanica TaxID=56036 RepID=A0AAD1ZH37_9LAMI|nr:unnamed protein product [Fraxinus pennsylvanica]